MLYANHWDYWQLYQKVTFDGVAKTIAVNPNVTTLNIRSDVYSAWVDWLVVMDNAKYLPAIRSAGYDPIPGGFTGDVYFLFNGWKLLVDLTKVAVTGVLYSDNYPTAYYGYDLRPQYPAVVSSLVSASISTQNVVTGTALTAEQTASAVWAANTRALTTPSAPTAEQIANATWSKALEGLTAEEMMRVMLAALVGKRQGLGTPTETYLGQDGITPRITLTADANGNGAPTLNGAA